MSPAVDGEQTGEAYLNREIICLLEAWDAETGIGVLLGPGTHADECRIHKNEQSEVDCGAEPYEVRFIADGRAHWCALPPFQARSRAVVPVKSEVVA